MVIGPVDQWKIACFASRRPWVQIPSGPLEIIGKIIRHLFQKNGLDGKNVDKAALEGLHMLLMIVVHIQTLCLFVVCIRNLDEY
jgi:hypothetical protein